MNVGMDVGNPGSAVLLGLFFLVSCAPAERTDANEAQMVEGPCAEVFGGRVCTFATLVNGEVAEFGATVPMATIEAATEGGEMVWPPKAAAAIPLPAEVQTGVGFDHLGVNWEANGHPPGLFFTPHFDFHFYTVAPEEVAAVDCADTTKPGALPAEYALPDLDVPPIGMLIGLCVPLMGMHAMRADEVDRGDPFSASMIMGYYGGGLTFLEPMVSKARLLEKAPFDLAMPSVPEAPAGVSPPTSFHATYDEATATYRLTFSGLHTMWEIRSGPDRAIRAS